MMNDISDEEIAAEMPEAQPVGFDNVTLVFAPGLLTGLLPNLAFQSVWPTMMNRFGVKIQVVDAHPMRSAEANVADLEDTLERGIGVSPLDASFITAEDDPTPPGDVILMGYSKGAPDILSLLAARPDLAPRIKAGDRLGRRGRRLLPRRRHLRHDQGCPQVRCRGGHVGSGSGS